jgi:hypothetical protein
MNSRQEEHESTIRAAREIRDILMKATIGWANERAKREIQNRILSVRRTATDPYIREKAGQIEGWAEILFSTRKWQKYGSADDVRDRILRQCASMASRAELLISKPNSEV